MDHFYSTAKGVFTLRFWEGEGGVT